MVGQLMKGVQAQQIMGDIKHYALNDQETGRNIVNVILDKRAMRETDLLAFQIALRISQAAGVMCSYNKVNGDYACENDYLLNQVLKKDLGFQGLGAVGLGRHAQHHQGGLDRARSGDARRRLLRRAAEEGGGERRGARGAPQRHGASHSAQHVRRGRDRQSARRAAWWIRSAAWRTRSTSPKSPSCC